MTRRLMGYTSDGNLLPGLPGPRRVVLALEGGYSNSITAMCVAACVKALLTLQPSPDSLSLSSKKEGADPDEEAVDDLFSSEKKGPLATTGALLIEVAKVRE